MTTASDDKLRAKHFLCVTMTKIWPLTIYSIITPFDAFETHVFENIMENGANAPFSIIHSHKLLSGHLAVPKF